MQNLRYKEREVKLDELLLGFPGVSDGKEATCEAGDLGSIPGLGRSPGGSPRTEEPGGLQSVGSKTVGHDGVTKRSTQHVLVFLEPSLPLLLL